HRPLPALCQRAGQAQGIRHLRPAATPAHITQPRGDHVPTGACFLHFNPRRRETMNSTDNVEEAAAADGEVAAVGTDADGASD
ncbi:hypothetical protein OFC55_39175, partial [Escherichia coli]|nr:hypothetical protein [Escherichia coli]